jgi:hypothetical protein
MWIGFEALIASAHISQIVMIQGAIDYIQETNETTERSTNRLVHTCRLHGRNPIPDSPSMFMMF